MAWTNYRTIVDRFSHIDAEFVSSTSTLSPDGGQAALVVRFYPWWEHPSYVAARDRGEDWGFSSYESGKRDVCVRALEPWALRLSPRREVLDWRFEDQHPLLWDFADRVTVYANAAFDRGAFFDGLIALELPNVAERDLLDHIELPSTATTPLGIALPAQLHEPVLSVFHRLGVPVFSPAPPRLPEAAVVFLIDDDDYIVARDFEVDVPEFHHDAAWFRPSGSGHAG